MPSYSTAVKLLALAAALLLAAPAAAALPKQGVVVPGRSLGGIRLGMTKKQVVARYGTSFGICRGCRATTWYFTFEPFQPQGVGLSFRGGRVDALWTLWQPPGWRTSDGLALGDDVARITTVYGALDRRDCPDYYTLSRRTAAGMTEFYVVDERLWGLGVSRAPQPCR
jgi:hypothetical protein